VSVPCDREGLVVACLLNPAGILLPAGNSIILLMHPTWPVLLSFLHKSACCQRNVFVVSPLHFCSSCCNHYCCCRPVAPIAAAAVAGEATKQMLPAMTPTICETAKFLMCCISRSQTALRSCPHMIQVSSESAAR
jgi:hypothetical protein